MGHTGGCQGEKHFRMAQGLLWFRGGTREALGDLGRSKCGKIREITG